LKLKFGETLHQVGEVTHRAYFINSGILLCILTSDKGTNVEVGLAGREGIACALIALTGSRSAT
jgi:hypothetical protein